MKIIVTHDEMASINVERINCIYIDNPKENSFILWADDQIISTYSTLSSAKAEMVTIVNMACTQEDFVYYARNNE